jgi:hypothetical protein
MVEVQIPFTIENLMVVHTCICCGKPLVSAANIDINHATEEANQEFINTNYPITDTGSKK